MGGNFLDRNNTNTNVIIEKISHHIYIYVCVCEKDRQREKEEEEEEEKMRDIMRRKKRREEPQQLSSEPDLTKPSRVCYLLKEAFEAIYKNLRLPSGA